MEVDSFREQTVGWVQLADGTGHWYPVDGESFRLAPEREWSSPNGNYFCYGFTFCSGDYRLSGPVTNLVVVAVKR